VLILRRRAGEAIVIGGEVEIEVVEISRTRVKLGVKAPRSIGVMRREAIPVAADNRLAAGILGSHRNISAILRWLSGAHPKAAPGTRR
jgi:carbon storage regulator